MGPQSAWMNYVPVPFPALLSFLHQRAGREKQPGMRKHFFVQPGFPQVIPDPSCVTSGPSSPAQQALFPQHRSSAPPVPVTSQPRGAAPLLHPRSPEPFQAQRCHLVIPVTVLKQRPFPLINIL